ncbi:hypothetical protein AV654_19725 [Paenibacillus elgii]|uniref:Uncharacterized protein n=1 Tax=Paenibacillus elgii TaxID=189691 RepID=A0A163XP43_9BACL|nr:hypothetical protein [Paenibacillus elgii]KZE78207.1 hypothetical protein AV654_19725 [Paenibacillus elgii]
MESPVKVEMVYLGNRIMQNKRVYAWAKIDEIEAVLLYKKQPYVSSASVGAVYSIWFENDSYYTKGEYAPRYVRRYEDDTMVSKWAIADESAKQGLAEQALITKASKIEPMETFLNTLRKMSIGLTHTERRAFLSKIAEVILK